MDSVADDIVQGPALLILSAELSDGHSEAQPQPANQTSQTCNSTNPGSLYGDWSPGGDLTQQTRSPLSSGGKLKAFSFPSMPSFLSLGRERIET